MTSEQVKNRARWALNNAISSGKVKRKPCEVCGKRKTDAHHEDYDLPLMVRWLCPSHHRKLHWILIKSGVGHAHLYLNQNRYKGDAPDCGDEDRNAALRNDLLDFIAGK